MDSNTTWEEYWSSYDEQNVKEVIKYYEEFWRETHVLKEYCLKGKDLLEVGCGPAWYSIYLLKKYPEKKFNITGLDFSETGLKQARKLAKIAKVNLKLVKDDCKKMPFNTGSFDVVFSFGLNEHFEGKDRKKVWDEQLRVLKRKGHIVALVPYKYSPFYKLGKFLRELVKKWSFGLEIAYSEKEIKEMFPNKKIIFYHKLFLDSLFFSIPLPYKYSKKLRSFARKVKIPILDRFGWVMEVIIQK